MINRNENITGENGIIMELQTNPISLLFEFEWDFFSKIFAYKKIHKQTFSLGEPIETGASRLNELEKRGNGRQKKLI